MVDFVRAANPLWFFVDHTGQPLDDTYYAFFLQNDLPYAPQPVYQTPTGTEWENPLEIQPSGTLPNNLYFNPELVYRIEIRAGNTQNAQLIWLIENFIPGGGEDPVDSLSVNADNQITNPQFSLINFSSPLSGSASGEIDVAPGWVLDLQGSGTYTITRIPLNADDDVPTNAPYALQFALSGWSSAVLKQRFEQNGVLWGGKYLSAQVTGRIQGSSSGTTINAYLVRSDSTITLLFSGNLTSAYNVFDDSVLIPVSTNTQDPPAAFTEFQLHLPTTATITLTSFQIVPTDVAARLAFEQEPVERQIDHTFHYYRDSLLLMPKNSILTGWDFSLNPWQSRSVSSVNVAGNGYTADQTIIIQQNYVENNTQNNVAVQRAVVGENYAFQVTAVTAANRFAVLQYIDPATVRPYWGGILSSLVKARADKTGTDLNIKMRLIWRAGLPATLSRTNPIASWDDADGSEPVLASGWNYVIPKNDPIYNLSATYESMVFEAMELPVSTDADMTLGILIYTLEPMIESTPDHVYFKSVSLVPNEFAIDANPLTFDETLRQCQYYYEKSFPMNIRPNSAGAWPASSGNKLLYQLTINPSTQSSATSTRTFHAREFEIEWEQRKRATGTATIINPTTGTTNNVFLEFWNGNSAISNTSVTFSTYFVAAQSNTARINYNVNSVASMYTTGSVTGSFAQALMNLHYTYNARLGN